MSNTGSQAQEEMLAFMRPGIRDQRSGVIFCGSMILICVVLIFTTGRSVYDRSQLNLWCVILAVLSALVLAVVVGRIYRKRQAFDAWFQGLTAREQDSMTADFSGAAATRRIPLRVGREWLFLQGGTWRNSKKYWAIPLQDITGVMSDKEDVGAGGNENVHYTLRVRLRDGNWPTLRAYSTGIKANEAADELKQALDQVLGADKVELTKYAV